MSDTAPQTKFYQWIPVLPFAILASGVVVYVGNAIYTSVVKMPVQSGNNIGYILFFVINFVGNFAGGYCFVGVGTWFAPARHKQVALVLTLLTSIATVTILIIDITGIGFVVAGGRMSGACIKYLRIKKELTKL
jgi:hypothetical protein